jgi:hypothetical protein
MREYENKIADVSIAGLAAVSLITLQVMFSLATYDIFAKISLIAFSIALPMLACTFINLMLIRTSKQTQQPRPALWFWVIAITSTLIGVDTAFWHASWIAGGTFVAMSLIGFLFYRSFERNVAQSLAREQAEERANTEASL